MGEEKKPNESKTLGERLQDVVEAVLDGLQNLLNPPRPVRVPAGGRRPR